MERAWLYAGLLLAAGVGVAALRKSGGPRLGPGSRLLLVGDSLAVGLARPLKLLAQDGKVEFAALAQSCSHITQWSAGSCRIPASGACSSGGDDKCAKLRPTLDSFRPSLVLVCLGTNDEATSGDTQLALRIPAIDRLLAGLQASGAEVAWILPPKLQLRSPNQQGRVVELIRQRVQGSHLFDSSRLAIPQTDGIHSTPAGYCGWAGQIWQWLTATETRPPC